MLYDEEKKREMARSILPSQWRGAARAKAKIRRRNRRKIKEALRRARRGDLSESVDLRAEDRHLTRQIVQWRRGADKLNHFIRWASAVTADLPVEDRISAMRGVLPKGLIGEHAISHLERDKHFEPDHVHLWRGRWVHWTDRAEKRLRRVLEAPAGRHDLGKTMDACLVIRHRPTVWRLRDGERWLEAVAVQRPPRLGTDNWLRTLREATRWRHLDVEEHIFRHRLSNVVVHKGVRFVVREGLSDLDASGRPPSWHPEWLATAWAVAWLWESGWRDHEEVLAITGKAAAPLPGKLRAVLGRY